LDLLNSEKVPARNYSAIVHPHTLQFTTTRTKPSQSLSGNVFQRRSFLSFRVHALTGRRLSPNSLNSRPVLLIPPRHGQHIKHRFQQFYCCDTQLSHGPHRKHVFPITPLLRVRNLLPSNGRCLSSH
jgi:hypothetical protein